MQYTESPQILDKINSSSKFLINCHHNPDADSVGSALSMYQALLKMGKEARIVTPTPLDSSLKFLPHADKIEVVDFHFFDPKSFDVFITLDSASWNRVAGAKDVSQPDMFFVVIDHHKTNQKYGSINLIDSTKGSNCEILYGLFEDWDVKLDKDIAQTLLTGVIGDTGAFRFPEATSETLAVAQKLMDIGASKDDIIYHLYQSYKPELVKFWIEILKTLTIDTEYHFVWAAVNAEIYAKYGRIMRAKSELSDLLFSSIADTRFGMIILEESPGLVNVSFRSRDGIDVSKLASRLGGGGHQWASAGRVYDMSFDAAVTHTVETAQKFAQEE